MNISNVQKEDLVLFEGILKALETGRWDNLSNTDMKVRLILQQKFAELLQNVGKAWQSEKEAAKPIIPKEQTSDFIKTSPKPKKKK